MEKLIDQRSEGLRKRILRKTLAVTRVAWVVTRITWTRRLVSVGIEPSEIPATTVAPVTRTIPVISLVILFVFVIPAISYRIRRTTVLHVVLVLGEDT